MPHVHLVCPHCEKQSEVHVASVTRSRACPLCGYNVLLQVSGKATKTTRKALLVNIERDAGAEAPAEGPVLGVPAYLPQPLEGDAFDRMKADPEIQTIRQQLTFGLVTLVIAIVGVIVWHEVPTAQPVIAEKKPLSPAVTPEKGQTVKRSVPPVAASVIGAKRSEEKRAGVLNFASKGVAPAPGQVSSGTRVGGGLEREEQVRKVLAAFLAAETVDAMLPTVAYRGAMEESIREYYMNHSLFSVRPSEILAINDPLLPRGAMGMQVTLGSGRRFQVNILATDDRHLGVDWPSYVGLSDMEWSQFVSTRPSTPSMFRVFVEPGDFYAADFADVTKLRCFKITTPEDLSEAPFYAYAERFSALDKSLETALQGRSSPVPMALRLRFSAGSTTDNQVLIDSIVSSSWVILPEAKTAQVKR